MIIKIFLGNLSTFLSSSLKWRQTRWGRCWMMNSLLLNSRIVVGSKYAHSSWISSLKGQKSNDHPLSPRSCNIKTSYSLSNFFRHNILSRKQSNGNNFLSSFLPQSMWPNLSCENSNLFLHSWTFMTNFLSQTIITLILHCWREFENRTSLEEN